MKANRFMLPLDLQFFAEDNGTQIGGNNNAGDNGQNQDQNGQGSNNDTAGQQGNDGSQNQNQQQNENFIPKSRFDEVNNKYKELQDQLDAFTKKQQQEELDAKKKKGEFENLYNEASQELENTKSQFEQTSQRVEQLEGIIQTLVDAELEAVPEDMRDLVPENFTAEQKLSWITNAKKKGLFGATNNSKENEELGGATNNQQQQQQDVSKMSVSDLFRNAYGKK
jgi:hypothetical protein